MKRDMLLIYIQLSVGKRAVCKLMTLVTTIREYGKICKTETIPKLEWFSNSLSL